ncbi:MAG: hypothetical protein KGI06_05120 [Candidatus Micrarchaeota archaeon]|nr:hypothetical protein [Candidatus Micrarchaeota archaeon]
MTTTTVPRTQNSTVVEVLDLDCGIKVAAIGKKLFLRGQAYSLAGHINGSAIDKYKAPTIYFKTRDGNVYSITNGAVIDANSSSKTNLNNPELKRLTIKVGSRVYYKNGDEGTAPVSEIIVFERYKMLDNRINASMLRKDAAPTKIYDEFRRRLDRDKLPLD